MPGQLSLVRRLIRVYVYFFRGTPLIVLLFLAYFALPAIGIRLSALESGILAISLNSSAYVTENVRSALLGVDVSQEEAAALDGANQYQTLVYIVFPQAARAMVAPVTNESIALWKNTSLLAVISVAEVTRAGQLLASRYFAPFEVYFFLAFVYLAISSVITRGSALLEARLRRW